ncbi:hypothetical protein ISF_04528 [Cordyceps fumosorosea ARSEF 2679]|uniref:Uncharacterized protein n=1 Tax=Cordyceps fumosorosea (strain ARSEF 2679) TaxID=1081104 RepID=A0A167WI43_CORFA|nr:hypothetical protein ISF_04528 [Cordyceps fumosorosea ARSEF 2679]OAA63819.1 hypothetical protein ISF_04528 [Cordyceps fumosorosea ARSEF 2679]
MLHPTHGMRLGPEASFPATLHHVGMESAGHYYNIHALAQQMPYASYCDQFTPQYQNISGQTAGSEAQPAASYQNAGPPTLARHHASVAQQPQQPQQPQQKQPITRRKRKRGREEVQPEEKAAATRASVTAKKPTAKKPATKKRKLNTAAGAHQTATCDATCDATASSSVKLAKALNMEMYDKYRESLETARIPEVILHRRDSKDVNWINFDEVTHIVLKSYRREQERITEKVKVAYNIHFPFVTWSFLKRILEAALFGNTETLKYVTACVYEQREFIVFAKSSLADPGKVAGRTLEVTLGLTEGENRLQDPIQAIWQPAGSQLINNLQGTLPNRDVEIFDNAWWQDAERGLKEPVNEKWLEDKSALWVSKVKMLATAPSSYDDAMDKGTKYRHAQLVLSVPPVAWKRLFLDTEKEKGNADKDKIEDSLQKLEGGRENAKQRNALKARKKKLEGRLDSLENENRILVQVNSIWMSRQILVHDGQQYHWVFYGEETRRWMIPVKNLLGRVGP